MMNMIKWFKSLLTTPKKGAKIVKTWVVRPNRKDTTDELYDYIRQKNKDEKNDQTSFNP